MTRALLVATLLIVSSTAASGQDAGILHIRAVVVDAAGTPTPVPRHALLISDEPPSAPPRRILTAIDGTANVRLRPGTYTVESDQPVVFSGKAYQWTQHVTIVAGRDAVLELTAGNAEVDLDASATPLNDNPSFLMPQWQDSVVAIWTPSTHGSGFLIDLRRGGPSPFDYAQGAPSDSRGAGPPSGLIATNQRVIGTATSVEVQLSPDVKVAATVLVADQKRDVAVLWIHPSVVAALRSIPIGCGQAVAPPMAAGQELFTIGAPLRVPKRLTYLTTELRIPSGSAGGPVFTAGGAVVGITTPPARVVPIEDACEVVAAAEKKMTDAAPPSGTHLPVDPVRPFPADALKDAVKRRAGSLNPYQMSAADFEVTMMTPVIVAGREYDFGHWSEYMVDVPPVLLIRATPKMVESLWTKVGRAAAMTQGVALPPMKRIKSGFSRMRAFCGDAEVMPIHPFTLELRVSETEAVDEGLYVFDPGALGPHCGAVKLMLYSEKEPAKADTRVVEPRVVEQIWQDFEPYRQ